MHFPWYHGEKYGEGFLRAAEVYPRVLHQRLVRCFWFELMGWSACYWTCYWTCLTVVACRRESASEDQQAVWIQQNASAPSSCPAAPNRVPTRHSLR